MSDWQDMVERAKAAIMADSWFTGSPAVAESLALAVIGAMRDWQPIETAPKDILTPILLGYFRENPDGSIYQEGGEPIVARWHSKHQKWVARKELLNAEGPFSPTHWMPLPEPPSTQTSTPTPSPSP